MARPKKEPLADQPEAQPAQETSGETIPDLVVEPVQPQPQVVGQTKKTPVMVEVISKFDRFVDLVMDIEITKAPRWVEMHPWLQAQVDTGLVIKC